MPNLDDDKLAVEALRQGAQDYLVKHKVNGDSLMRSIRYAIERKQIAQELYQARNELEIRVQERTSQLNESNQKLCWQASHDSLTGLLNRPAFESRVASAIIDAQNSEHTHLLCYLDLDQFKVVNDTCGHSAGDQLLCQVSQELQLQIRQSDVLARFGGDEFAFLLCDCPPNRGETITSEIINNLVNIPFTFQNKVFRIGVSIGIVPIDARTDNKEQLLSLADLAMYTAKEQGGNCTHIYSDSDGVQLQYQGDMQRAAQIRSALAEDRFCLYYQEIQPIQGAFLGQPIKEVLLRLKDTDGKVLAPGAFIAAAERYKLMPQVDRWVIKTLFKALSESTKRKSLQPKSQIEAHLIQEPIYNINLSGTSFNDETFLDFVKQQFSLYAINPRKICFEVTETHAITHLKKAVSFIQELKQLGYAFALDDFGQGMSSLTYLRTLPVDYLKIDGQLIKPVLEEPVVVAIIESIVHIANAMNLTIIAEFVENQEILQRVQELGVDYVQGYAIGRPSPLEFSQDHSRQVIEQGILQMPMPLTHPRAV